MEGVDGSETASAENAEEVAEDDAEDDGKNKNESESSVHWRRRQRLFASERASLLSRLGATRAALRVLVDAGDIARAVALTHERAAPDPWTRSMRATTSCGTSSSSSSPSARRARWSGRVTKNRV